MKIFVPIILTACVCMIACTPKVQKELLTNQKENPAQMSEHEKKYLPMKIENPSTQAEIDRNLILQHAIDHKMDLTKHESGIFYQLTKEGTGEKPNDSSMVKAHYEGTLLDGTKFDSSYDRGQPLQFGLGQVIKGWQVAIPLLSKGGKGIFIIPSQLAYGNRSAGDIIKPNSVLIFDIELVDFN